MAVKYFYPKSNIIAFEPLLGPFNKFNQIFKNDSQVSVFNCAIGLDNKDTIIHNSKRDDSSSFEIPQTLISTKDKLKQKIVTSLLLN